MFPDNVSNFYQPKFENQLDVSNLHFFLFVFLSAYWEVLIVHLSIQFWELI